MSKSKNETSAFGGLQPVEVRATGATPLLLNAMPQETLMGLIRGLVDKPAKTAERATPRVMCEPKIHKLRDGRPCIPPNMLYSTLIAAGQFVRLDGKRQVSTATSTQLPGLMRLVSAEIPLVRPGTNEAAQWEVDLRQGRNPNGGEAVALVRPVFYEWEISFTIEVDRKVFPLESARALVDLAGRRCGLGDYRPNRKGTFGQFSVTRWELIELAEAE